MQVQEDFKNLSASWGYHLQLGWYLRGLQKLGLPAEQFIFIAIEKTAPFCVGVYRADREMINLCNERTRSTYARNTNCNGV